MFRSCRLAQRGGPNANSAEGCFGRPPSHGIGLSERGHPAEIGIFFIIDASLNGMAVRGTESEGSDPTVLPGIVPLDVPHLSRLSWELGSRVVTDEEEPINRWKHASNRWTLSLFEVTSNTVVIRVRTSVGRERFYGAIQSEIESALPEIETSPSWRQAE